MKEKDSLDNSLLRLFSFSEEQLNLFRQKLVHKFLKKGDFLLKQNYVCDSLSFIHRGSLRFYTHTADSELTFYFFTEGQWAADVESLLIQKPTPHFLEAAEDAEISVISLFQMHELMNADPCFRMLNALMAQMTVSTSHLIALNTKSPDERYSDLLATHPEWIRRFPQKQIASYLGITRETLSRVRSRIS